MTAERHELHELVDGLPEDQVAVVLADVRRRLARPANKGWAPEFFGIVEGSDLPKDLATHTEHYLRAAAPARPRPPRSRLCSEISTAPTRLLCHS